MSYSVNFLGILDLIKGPEMGGAPSMGGGPSGAPRAGHKYVSRKWNGSSWDYTYAGEEGGGEGGGAHPFQMSHGSDMGFSHSIPLTSGAMGAQSPEQAFHHSFHEATQHGSKHSVAHPHPNAQGQNLNIQVHAYGNDPSAKMVSVTDAQGKPVKIGSKEGPVSIGNFQKWYRNQRDSVDIADPESGGHLFTVRPNVGQVEGGMLRPPMNPQTNNKMWMIDYGKNADDSLKAGHEHMQASKQSKGAMTSNTKEGALGRVKQILQNRKLVQNPQDAKFARPENPNKKQAAQIPKEGSIAHGIENGKHQWRDAGGFKKRRFGASDEEREAAIQQVAKEFGGAIQNSARKIGDIKGVQSDALSGGGYAAPGDELHTQIGNALDNYDPSKGSFSGYLAGRNAGKIKYGMMNQANKETEGAAPMERTNAEGDTYNVGDRIAGGDLGNAAGSAEDQAINNMEGGGDEDAERSFGDWHKEQYHNLNKLDPSKLTPEQAQYLPKLKDIMKHPSFQSDPVQAQTHLIGALHKLGLGHVAASTTAAKPAPAQTPVAPAKPMTPKSPDQEIQDFWSTKPSAKPVPKTPINQMTQPTGQPLSQNTGHDWDSPVGFGRAATSIAKEMGANRQQHGDMLFGNVPGQLGKPFIHGVHQQALKNGYKGDLDQFKRQVVAANRAGSLVTNKADLVNVMNSNHVKEAATGSDHGYGSREDNSQIHLIDPNEEAPMDRKQATYKPVVSNIRGKIGGGSPTNKSLEPVLMLMVRDLKNRK